MKMHTGV